jgi:hypothetical protein
VLNQGCRDRTTRQAYREVVAQAKQPVVPSLADIDEREMHEVGVLLPEQRPNQGWIDGDFGRRDRANGHVS